MRNTINSLSPGLLCAYVRNQNDHVRANINKALGIVFPEKSQLSDNQLVTKSREENYPYNN